MSVPNRSLYTVHAVRPIRDSCKSDNMSPEMLKTTQIENVYFSPSVHDHPYSWDRVLPDGGWLKTQWVGGPFVCKLSGDKWAWRDRRCAWARRSYEVHGSRSSEGASRDAHRLNNRWAPQTPASDITAAQHLVLSEKTLLHYGSCKLKCEVKAVIGIENYTCSLCSKHMEFLNGVSTFYLSDWKGLSPELRSRVRRAWSRLAC